MDWTLFTQIASTAGVLCAIVFGFAVWLKNKTGEAREQSAIMTRLESVVTDIRETRQDVKDILSDNKAFRETQIRDGGRIDHVEHRLNQLEERVSVLGSMKVKEMLHNEAN